MILKTKQPLNQASPGTYSSPQLLDLFIGSTLEVFILVDTSLDIVVFNNVAYRAALKFTGKELKVRSSILNFITPEQKIALDTVFSLALKGASTKFKYHLPNITFQLTVMPVLEEFEVRFLSLTCIDITGEENALLKISAERQLLKLAESISNMGSWEWDIPNDRVAWSDELYRLLGLQPGRATPSKDLGFEFLYPGDLQLVEKTLSHSFKTGEPFNEEIRILAHDGQLKYMYCQGVVLRNAAGRNLKMIGTFHDITNKKLLEESIKRKDLRFQSLIEYSGDLILQVNQAREIVYASPALFDMMGLRPDEIMGDRMGLHVYPEDLPRLIKAFENMVENPGVPFTYEYRVVRKDGSNLWVEGTITNLFDVPGVETAVLNQRDISQRKESERLLQQLNETLEVRASRLSSSNVELERFAYVASHDLQEPLRMISSFMQLLSQKYEGQLDEKAQQYIHYAVDGAGRMKNLINDLLEYSRAGLKSGARIPVDMTEVLKTVALVFKDQLTSTNGKLIYDNLPAVIAEKSQMISLVQNLVGNAIKYKGETAPVITIRGKEKEKEWLFEVEDNGIGIPPGSAEQVFNIFQRLHSKNEFEGTGIGLSICKKIVEGYGGRIWITPASVNGSIFHFSISKPQPVAGQITNLV